MEEIEELILYENENTRLDFKRDEYRKENYVSLLKDVLSMANANTSENRYIIIGMKPKSIDDRGLKGLKIELTDAATFQQLVYENIEPEISIEYFPYKFQKLLFGIIKISNCNNQPYLMKKNYGNSSNKLFKGEGYIRKGTHQTRLTRNDYSRFLQNKIDSTYFNEEVLFSFKTLEFTNEIGFITWDDIIRPSHVQKEKIQKIIIEKEKKAEEFERLGFSGIDPDSLQYSNAQMNAIITGGGTPYESRSIETLKKNLENIEKTYSKDDYYVFFEKNANKCNVSITNQGTKYIEDASIILKIPKLEGLFVLDQVYEKPNRGSTTPNIDISSINYPQVTQNEDYYIINNSIGNIKHKLPKDAFDIDLRIFANDKLTVKSFKIYCELYAKNIKASINQELEIKTRKNTTYNNV